MYKKVMKLLKQTQMNNH